MHSLIQKLLDKRKIKNLDSLRSDEKEDYDRWQKILSNENVTTDNIRDFCNTQIAIIEGKWRDLDRKDSEKLIPYHTVYCAIRDLINSPQAERENLEKYLNQLLTTD